MFLKPHCLAREIIHMFRFLVKKPVSKNTKISVLTAWHL